MELFFIFGYSIHAGPDLGGCKKFNGVGPPQGMGLKNKLIVQ